jgi:hypothetical protein
MRIKENPIARKEHRNMEKLQNYAGQNESFSAEIISEKRFVKFIVKPANSNTRYVIPNRNDVDIADNHSKRFMREKTVSRSQQFSIRHRQNEY